MHTIIRTLAKIRILPTLRVGACCFSAAATSAQQPVPRITAEIDNSERMPLKQSHSPLAKMENDAGRLSPGTTLHGVSLVFSRSAEQEGELQNLISQQQDPSSALYHRWLTPEEFAARFGTADSDLAEVQSWLEKQGLIVEAVARSKNRITFSGSVEQLEGAFGTELRYYNFNGNRQFAPSSDISIPAALSSVVQSVANLSSFRPRPHVKLRPPQRAPAANFTSGQSGNHYLTPKDVATIYSINGAYNAGYTGAGQSIAVVGQSAIVLSDIEHFQTAAGLTVKDPTLVLVPDSGTSTIVSGDEAESDLDLEYSSTIGKGASIYFVYAGNNANYSVWDSIQYAVDTRLSPIISVSYGVCETALSANDYATLNGVLAQAATQGQTVVAAAGDSGSTDCYGQTGLTTAQQQALAVDFPASSQYVTAMGGTEFSAASVASTNTTYWKSSSGGDVVSSALSYIPEQVWNDDSSSSGLSSTGGGVSTLTSRPSWQTGVNGIPSGNYRLVPDVSFTASPDNAGFLYCSSDSSTGVTGSCSNGFRDTNSTYLTVAGGTSFDSPIFAGMLAILNEKLNSTGLGVINSTLYSLASDSSTYSTAFHDVTSGSNKCTAGSTYCSSAGASQYSATTGYDQATGLGSLDFYNLQAAWPSTGSSLTSSVTTLSPAATAPTSGASDLVTIAVASPSSSATATPTGTLTIVVDGTTEASSLALSAGSATYTFSSTRSGTHTITAKYSGDSTFTPSTGTLILTVGNSGESFTLTATNLTVSSGNSGTSTITITPKNGYTGTIAWTVSSSSSLTNVCYSLPNTTVSGTSAITATMTIYTDSSSCASSAVRGTIRMGMLIAPNIAGGNPPPFFGIWTVLLVFGLALSRVPKHGSHAVRLTCAAVCLSVAFAVSGCSGAKSSSSSSTKASTGTYALTITGTDTASSSITAATTMVLTID